MNILMLRHSAGFEHTYLPDAEVALKKIGVKNNWHVRTTHHCQGINAENLAKIDLLVFATTGNLPFDDDQEALNQDGAKIIASFPSDMWENRDKRCIDAVKGLLDLDPKKRLTAEQFCNHEWLKRGHDICTPQIQEQLNEKPNADALPAEQPTQPVEVTNDTGTSPANIKEETSNDTDVADKLASIPSKPAANSSESATIEVSNVPTPNQVVEEHQSIPKQA